jgi:hypothetical protein
MALRVSNILKMERRLKVSQNGLTDEVRLPPATSSSSSTKREHLPSSEENARLPENLMYSSQSTNNRRAKKVWIGGPGTILPVWLESLVSWTFAISCLGVALYHWIQQLFGSSLFGVFQLPKQRRRPVLPLVTHSRYEMTNASGIERYQQLIQYLESQQNSDSTTKSIEAWTDQEWVQTIRNDGTARRLVSLIRLHQDAIPATLYPLMEILERIWPELLHLPPLPSSSSGLPTNAIEISIVTSAYKEDGRELAVRFQKALDMATHPGCIELILVNAGHCRQLNLIATSTTLNKFAKITTIDGRGGGRGPSLNQGAALAQGRILTCLHADTMLSMGWDMAIRKAFDSPSSNTRPITNSTTTACAFSFAIDTTPQGLQGGPFPPGIQAIEATANWRTHLFHLPYGDQCLSIPKVYFDYLGGYPHQCLMEDYELVRLLRHRVAYHRSTTHGEERLEILSHKAYCGPRRWQTFGVLYVTYTNSRCVNLYASGELSPDDLYQVYYGVPANPSGVERKSPWEVRLEEQLLK